LWQRTKDLTKIMGVPAHTRGKEDTDAARGELVPLLKVDGHYMTS